MQVEMATGSVKGGRTSDLEETSNSEKSRLFFGILALLILKLFMRDAGKEAETERSGAEVQAGERGEEKVGEQDQAREREFWKAGDLSGGRVQAGE